MRKSLRELQQIEAFCLGQMNKAEKQSFKTSILLQPELREKVESQKTVYRILQWVSRLWLRNEIRDVETQIFLQPDYRAFQVQISRIFS